MKRITERHSDGRVTILSDGMTLSEVFARLANYEDLDESGKLVRLPCKIGDIGYIIRNYHGVLKVHKGKITDMYFSDGMQLCANVQHLGRGVIGEQVFLSKEDAVKKIDDLEGPLWQD